MASPKDSGNDVAFLLNSSQPDDLDELISFDPKSKEARIAGGIQLTVFLGEETSQEATDLESMYIY